MTIGNLLGKLWSEIDHLIYQNGSFIFEYFPQIQNIYS